MKNKILFRSLIGIGIFIFIFIGFAQVILVPQNPRLCHSIELPKELQNEVVINTKGLTDLQIINYCVEKTSQILEYSKKESDLINLPTSKAHCVTYAKVCATLCNLAFTSNNIPNKAYCVVGYVEVYGINICNVLYKITNSAHYINHDFVKVITPNNVIYVDPCSYDLIGMDLKQINAV